MDVTRALATEGFMQEAELEYLAKAALVSRCIVEIGSWKGRSACALGANTNGTVFCVDKFVAGDGGDLITPFRRNTEGLPVVPIQLDSLTAADMFKRARLTFDMIFIDGDHEEPQISRDIDAWSSLLAPNGIFCGHDYGDPNWPDVKTAVDALVGPVRTVQYIWTKI